MARARRRDQWSRTAAVMALLANIHRDPRRRSEPFTAADFSPMTESRTSTDVSAAEMRQALEANGIRTVFRKGTNGKGQTCEA